MKYSQNKMDVVLYEGLEDVPIFRLQDEVLRRPFVTDKVKEVIDRAKLKGMGEILVWDSEHEGDDSLYPVYPY